MKVKYFHPVKDKTGKYLSTANITWATRDRGNAYYRVSKYAMNGGSFPPTHPCAPFESLRGVGDQVGESPTLNAFRARGYWASCFPEGDGITFAWWAGFAAEPKERTAAEVMQDIRECFGWDVVSVSGEASDG